MSKPTNSAARNQMTEWERQCYDWGWEDAEERIIKLLRDSMAMCDKNKEPEGCEACYGQRDAIALIKGEQK
jgi:hypothetical protein